MLLCVPQQCQKTRTPFSQDNNQQVPKALMGTREAWPQAAIFVSDNATPPAKRDKGSLASAPDEASEAHPDQGNYQAGGRLVGRKEALISQSQQLNVAGKGVGGGRKRLGFLFPFL